MEDAETLSASVFSTLSLMVVDGISSLPRSHTHQQCFYFFIMERVRLNGRMKQKLSPLSVYIHTAGWKAAVEGMNEGGEEGKQEAGLLHCYRHSSWWAKKAESLF